MKIYARNFVKNSSYFFASSWIDDKWYYFIGCLSDVRLHYDDFWMPFEKIAVVSDRTYDILFNEALTQKRLIDPLFYELVLY